MSPVDFSPFLAKLEASLDIPYPARREVVAELASHLEALAEDLGAEGLEPEAAREQALATLAADHDFLDSMQELHRTAVASALARLPRPVSLGLEHGTITVIGALLLLTVLTQEAPMLEFILAGGFFMIPLNLAALAILFFGIERIYSLFIKKDHSPENLDRRLTSLRFLAIACALTGIVGTLVGFFHAFSQAEAILARHDGVFPIYDVAAIALTTTIWGLTLALLAVTFRFVTEAMRGRILAARA